jgi:hypothetical protein
LVNANGVFGACRTWHFQRLPQSNVELTQEAETFRKETKLFIKILGLDRCCDIKNIYFKTTL